MPRFHRLAAVLVVAIPLIAAAQNRRPPRGAVHWAGTPSQPNRIELLTVQQATGTAMTVCFPTPAAHDGYRLDVAFDTSGRAIWTSADADVGPIGHCVATVAHNNMRLNPFQGTQTILVRFPLADSHW